MNEHDVLIEELTLTPLAGSAEVGIKPLRITIDGKALPLVWDALEIKARKDAAASNSN